MTPAELMRNGMKLREASPHSSPRHRSLRDLDRYLARRHGHGDHSRTTRHHIPMRARATGLHRAGG